ncbi:MAG: hypothetical protein ABMA26_06765 [Limisphaerales bacterium]
MPLFHFMNAVVNHSNHTAADYQQLVPTQFGGDLIHPQPIPFFGNIQSPDVEFFTIGANPSAGEFYRRDWPNGDLTPAQLGERLLHYFDEAQAPGPHPWFSIWNTALAPLGIRYGHNLAHLDLSYRATKSMGTFRGAQRDLFRQMVNADSQFFFQLLEQVLPRARGLLMAGTAGRYYINQLFQQIAAPHFQLNPVQTLHPGPKARIEIFRLQGAERTIPVFFCSSSPSDRWNRGRLASNVQAVVPELQQHGF